MELTARSLHERLVEAALKQGAWSARGVDWHSTQTRALYTTHVDRFENWLKSGHQAQMQYLHRGLDRRRNPELVFPGLQSVFVALFPYSAHLATASHPNRSADRAAEPWTEGPTYARYLNGPDYHLDLKSRLTAVVSQAGLTAHQFKICVDTSAVLERAWAEIAGLGFIGKNTLLIDPKRGSYCFIGVVFLSEPMAQEPKPMPSLCGHCVRCLEGCPTKAFRAPYELDSRACLSQITLEARGREAKASLSPAPQERRAWIAGCDRCQEVCPFNFRRVRSELPDERLLSMSWIDHLLESRDQYLQRVDHSALDRIRFEDFRINLLKLFWNLPEGVRRPILEQLPTEVLEQIKSEAAALGIETSE